MKKSEVSFLSGGHKIIGFLDVPNKNVKSIIILLHGLTNSHNDCPLINETASLLLKKGLAVFRFDYFGSGKSEGEFRDKTFSILVKNTEDAINYITSNYNFKKIGLWGRSLGAVFAGVFSSDPRIFATTLISDTLSTKISFSRYFKKGKLVSEPIHGTGTIKGEPILTRQYFKETTWIDKQQKEKLKKTKNVLIMQGTNDKTILDLSWAKQIYNLVNHPKKLIFIKGADHAYRGYETQAVNEIVDWFAKNR